MLGVLGGGQLGRMLAQVAERLDVETRLYDPNAEACAGQVASLTSGAWDDLDAVRRWAEACDVVTYEFENVPEATARAVDEVATLRPGLQPLVIAQDRVRERELFRRLEIPTPKWAKAETAEALERAARTLPLPAIVKATRGGYDGKGQMTLASAADAASVFAELGSRTVILDERVAFDREVSCVGAFGVDGSASIYPLAENVHHEGILVRSTAPAAGLKSGGAVSALRSLATELGYVGVLAVEFFDVGGRLLANEFAPRVHNTGHWTMDGTTLSQFEAHVRAVMGMGLPEITADRPTVMANLIGSDAVAGEVESHPALRVHRYGKAARPGRKVGHVNVLIDACGGGPEEAASLADRATAGNVYAE